MWEIKMHVNTNNKIKPQFLFALKKLFKSPPPHLKKMTWVVYRGIYNSRVIVLAMTSGGKETKNMSWNHICWDLYWKLKLVTHLRAGIRCTTGILYFEINQNWKRINNSFQSVILKHVFKTWITWSLWFTHLATCLQI